METLAENRVKYRLVVDLYCAERDQHRKCRVSNIGLDGMFVVGLPCFRHDQRVRATFGRSEGGALSLPCRVDQITLDGADLKFDNPSPQQIEELREVIYPHWNGHDLLEGVLILSNWVEADDFAGWLRLLTLVQHWQRSTVGARTEFSRSRIASPMTVPPAERLIT